MWRELWTIRMIRVRMAIPLRDRSAHRHWHRHRRWHPRPRRRRKPRIERVHCSGMLMDGRIELYVPIPVPVPIVAVIGVPIVAVTGVGMMRGGSRQSEMPRKRRTRMFSELIDRPTMVGFIWEACCGGERVRMRKGRNGRDGACLMGVMAM